jgi:hypothetical protein
MQILKATGLDRKFGGARWRDLPFNGPFLEMLFTKRTRLSYFTLLATTTHAALFKESHMQILKATDLDGKSRGGGAEEAALSSLYLAKRYPSILQGLIFLSRGENREEPEHVLMHH